MGRRRRGRRAARPQSVAVHPFTHDIFVAWFQEPALAVFERDSVSDEPAYLGMEKNGVNGVVGLSGVRAVTVSPNGLHVYATGYWDKAVVVWNVFLPAYTCRWFSMITRTFCLNSLTTCCLKYCTST